MNLAKLLVAIGATTSGFQRSMKAAERRVDALERRTNGLRRGMGRAGGAMRDVAKIAAGVLLVGILAVTAALGASVSAAIDYEDAFAGVRKTVDATEPELAALSREIRIMATEIPVAATELAGLAETAGALGVPTKQIGEFVRVTAMIGATTNVSAEEAADALGRLSNILGLTESDYLRFASALVATGNAGASTEAEILEITKRMGAAGKLAGLTTPQILGWASAIASVTGLEPERGGTAFQAILLSVTKMTSKLGPKLKTLASTAGMSAKQFKKLFSKDANKALLAFIKGLDKLPKGKRLAILEKLGFNESGQIRALLGLASSHEEVARQLGLSTEEWEKNTAAQAEFDKKMATTKSQLDLLGANVLELGMTLGDILLPRLTPVIKGINDWFQANRPLVEQLIGDFATGIQTVVGGISSWIDENGPLIHQIGTLLWGALTTIWTVLTTQVIPALFGTGGKGGIIPAVIELGRQIFEWLVPKVRAFITTLTEPGGVIESVSRVAGPIIGSLITAFSTVVDALFGTKGKKGLIPALGDLIGKMWGDGKGPLALAVKGIAHFFETILFPAIEKVVGVLTLVITKIGQVLDLLPRLKSDLQNNSIFADIGRWWEDVTPDRKAAGGSVRNGAVSLVGEEGPELVKWGGNGFVTPADLSADAMASSRTGGDSGDTYHVTITNPEPRAADDDIGRVLRRIGGLGMSAARGWAPS